MQQERTPLDVAWAAGLFEGEGCWNAFVRESGKVQMQARLGMTDRDVVERFAAIVRCGSIHRVQPGTGGHKSLHVWCVYEAERVREVIDLLMPYLGERRRARAEEVLRMGAGVRSHNAKKTHCPQGHALDGDNLVLESIKGGKYMARRCKECRREQSRERARRRLGITPDNYRVT